MGQKVHPLGFRLNTTQKHKSTWFAQINQYSSLLEQDAKIREYITANYDSAGISDIEIERTYKLNNIFLKIYVAKPGVIITESGSGLINLTKKLKSLLPRVNKISIDVFEVAEPDTHANLLAQFIANQLVRRVAFKRAVRKAIDRAQAQDIKGIKVQIAGRLNGAEIARTEWVKEGRMPLQTLRAEIDYATASAKTIYGILGVKVWLFKGESMS
uniref:Small ribosomal subunit protein uS3c n=1 Tax=Aureococcus anophagefferens TaxID=44056 RepID=C6KIL0_AURAN|nr:30S ribosomal protein S3 [Aureococcus anophagefferens]ACS36816.1 30S ribosomal protein S3 [Aureococcus anophagefferens]